MKVIHITEAPWKPPHAMTNHERNLWARAGYPGKPDYEPGLSRRQKRSARRVKRLKANPRPVLDSRRDLHGTGQPDQLHKNRRAAIKSHRGKPGSYVKEGRGGWYEREADGTYRLSRIGILCRPTYRTFKPLNTKRKKS